MRQTESPSSAAADHSTVLPLRHVSSSSSSSSSSSAALEPMPEVANDDTSPESPQPPRHFFFKRCDFTHGHNSRICVVPVVGGTLLLTVVVEDLADAGAQFTVDPTRTDPQRLPPPVALRPSQYSKALVSVGPDTTGAFQVRCRWLRGPPQTVCLFHPHIRASLQCAETLRCYCSPECFREGFARSLKERLSVRTSSSIGPTPGEAGDAGGTAGWAPPMRKPRNPFCLGVPCMTVKALQDYRDLDLVHLKFMRDTGLAAPGTTGRQAAKWRTVCRELSYTPTTADIGRPLRVEVWLQQRHRAEEVVPASGQSLKAFEELTSKDDVCQWRVDAWPSPEAQQNLTPLYFRSVPLGCVVPQQAVPPPAPFVALTTPCAHLDFPLAPRGNHSRAWQLSLFHKLTQERVPNPGNFPSFSAMTWNILADLYCKRDQFPYCENYARSWVFRRSRITATIIAHGADIVCLQEVQEEHYANWFVPHLAQHGYDGVYKRKSSAVFATTEGAGKYTIDGCATFYRTDRFRLIDSAGIEFEKVVKERGYGWCKALLKDNIAVLVLLEDKLGPKLKPPEDMPIAQVHPNTAAFKDGHVPERRVVAIANAHVIANPTAVETKLAQVQILIDEVQQWVNDVVHRICETRGAVLPSTGVAITPAQFHAVKLDAKSSKCSAPTAPSGGVPRYGPALQRDPDSRLAWSLRPASRPAVIIAGDFNSPPRSDVYNFILTGNCASSSYKPIPPPQHDLRFSSSMAVLAWRLSCAGLGQCFESADACEPQVTNYCGTFRGCLDYLFFDRESLALSGGRLPVGPELLQAEAERHQLLLPLLPSVLRPSDHLPLMASYAWKDVDDGEVVT